MDSVRSHTRKPLLHDIDKCLCFWGEGSALAGANGEATAGTKPSGHEKLAADT